MSSIVSELPLIHRSVQDVMFDLKIRGINEMRHVRGLGCVHHKPGVRADRHAFGFDPHRDFCQNRVAFGVCHSHQIVVLVRDIQRIARRVQSE